MNIQVRDGRPEELSKLPGFDGEHGADPTSQETFRSAILDWDACSSEPGCVWFERYRQLIALRRERLVPLASGLAKGGRHMVCGGVFRVEWPLDEGRCHVLVANPSDRFECTPFEVDLVDVIYALGEHRPDGIGAWSLVFAVIGSR